MKESIAFLKNTIKTNSKVIMALSGGPDSMCLLFLLLNLQKEINFEIICAHVNHNVRKESFSEENFVKRICEQYHCKFETIKLNIKEKNNFENRARKERYQFLKEIVLKYKANYLLTAHHGDDLIETILMRLTRGSSLNGYIGFKKRTIYEQFELLRPLIFITKEEILKWCQQNNISYCNDQSNEWGSITRNRYRKNILPFLKQENRNVHKKYLKFSEELQSLEEYLEKNIQIALTRVSDFDKVNLHEFNKLEVFLRKRVIEYILKEEYQEDICLINERHVSQILHMCELKKPNVEIFLPLHKRLVKEYNTLYFCNKKDSVGEKYLLGEYLKLNEHEEFLKLTETDIIKSNFIIRLNTKELVFPLYVRNRKVKDKMEIKNLNGSKKIKDIFIDEKIPKKRRDTFPIVVDSNDTVVWLPGLKKSKFDKNKEEFYDIIYKYNNSEERNK